MISNRLPLITPAVINNYKNFLYCVFRSCHNKIAEKTERIRLLNKKTKLTMNSRYLQNPFPEYDEKIKFQIPEENVKSLICTYVDAILENTRPDSTLGDCRGDLYVGNAGIAYMFWKLSQSNVTKDLYPALEHAEAYMKHAKTNAVRHKKRADERCAFLCGNAGIYAVAAAISYSLKQSDNLKDDLKHFDAGYEPSLTKFSTHGCDEILVGRAGYLTGCYWLNDIIKPPPVDDCKLAKICETMIESGRNYSIQNQSPLPLMYQYHGTEYFGAAHGLTGILFTLLNGPWFKRKQSKTIDQTIIEDIKKSIDFYLNTQDFEGNFPVALEDLKSGREKRLLHWCHGSPGSIYLFAKAYIVFNDEKYLTAACKAGDLIWEKGLLRKGPGICHGIAGNGYVFLLLYRLTRDLKHLYRANKFMEFLTNSDFKTHARTPDRPYSLYEGVAGTVCYLIDLLEPENAHFPFMEVFN